MFLKPSRFNTLSETESYYCFLLGGYPGGEDIASYVRVGQRTSWTFENVKISSGLSCFATVTGK